MQEKESELQKLLENINNLDTEKKQQDIKINGLQD